MSGACIGSYQEQIPGNRHIQIDHCEFDSLSVQHPAQAAIQISSTNIQTLGLWEGGRVNSLTITDGSNIGAIDVHTWDADHVEQFTVRKATVKKFNLFGTDINPLTLSSIWFQDSPESEISLSTLTLNDNLVIKGSGVRSVTLTDVEIKGTVTIENVQHFKLVGGKFKTISIIGGIRTLEISGNPTVGQAPFLTGHPVTNVVATLIDDLTISCNFESDGVLSIKNTATHLSISNTFSIKSFVVQDSSIESFNMRNVDLETSKLEIRNTVLRQVRYSGVAWPSIERTVGALYQLRLERKETIKLLEELNEGYRQLRLASSENLHKVDARNFLKAEMQIYHRIVWLQFIGGVSIANSFGGSLNFRNLPKKALSFFRSLATLRIHRLDDLLILGTNRYFSDYGLSIWRPFTYLFVFHTFLFWVSHEQFGLTIDFENHSNIALCRGLKLYLYLLSPLHDFVFVNPVTNNEITVIGLTDFLMRIFSSYFIYYFLKAGRKYNLS